MQRRLVLLFAIAVSLLGTACATRQPPPPVPKGERFSALSPVPQGKAVLYVFRPYFSDLLVTERPILLVNGEPKALLGYDQFDFFTLPPGEHTVSLQGGAKESPIWRSQHSLRVEADTAYFLALWNITESDARTELNLLPVGPGLLLLPVTVGGPKSVGIRYELVSTEQALLVLQQSHRAEPVAAAAAAREP